MSTITLELPDALVKALQARDVQDISTFATGAMWDKIEYLDSEPEGLSEISEKEAEALAASNAKACLDGWESYKRGEYVTLEAWEEERKAKREERKKQRAESDQSVAA
jgi:hypothetical protein